jgi:branched-chain amino acid transport system ATP-binding protein
VTVSGNLEVRSLGRRFGEVVALADVSLDLGGPGVVGLIGPNGSGKTTLVNVISGVLRPTTGSVRWDGQEIAGTKTHRIARLGVVRTFQQAATFPGLSVRENAVIALEAAGRPAGEVVELLGGAADVPRFGALLDYAEERAGDVPFGIGRLLGIALAMARTPRLLLLDEPAAGLNDGESAVLGETITEIAQAGTSVVCIDHDMHFLLPLCRRVIALDAGSLMADGTPDEVRNDPRVISTYLGEGIAAS